MKTQTDELSAKQLAVKLGVNLESIWRYVRRGMPHHRVLQSGKKSVLRFKWHEIEAWLDVHPVYGRTYHEGADAASVSGSPLEPLLPPSGSHATMLDRVRGQELTAFSEWQSAVAAGRPDMAAMRRHLHWTNLLAIIEKARIRSGEAKREMEAEIQNEVNAHIAEWSKPVRKALDTMPGALGTRCNPVDPTNATQALRDWVGQLVRLLERPVFPIAAQGGD